MFIEVLNKIGVDWILFLQNVFPNGEFFFSLVSRISDPLLTFIFYVPFVIALDINLGADLLVVTVMTEYINILLKWLLMEDRPYWWVKETNIYESTGKVPNLRQSSLTCETGPGSPSGHVMGFAAFFYVVMQWLIQKYIVNNSSRHYMETLWVSLLWTVFLSSLALVTMSRMYVATHFPHQCLLAIFLGILVAWILTSPNSRLSNWRTSSQYLMVIKACMLTVAVFGAYWLQKLFGVDPQWSVKLAFKWCTKQEYLHVNTTPLFSLVRACGAIFGVAFVSPVAQWAHHKTRWLLSLVGVSLNSIAFHLLCNAIPKDDVILFYLFHFFLHVGVTVALLHVIPEYTSKPVVDEKLVLRNINSESKNKIKVN